MIVAVTTTNMGQHRTERRAWLSGFATGVAVGGMAVYLKHTIDWRRPRVIRQEGTVIPIE